jgi:hypothetical protein
MSIRGFATGLMLKDLRLAAQAAQDVGADVPMGARARICTKPLPQRAMRISTSRQLSGVLRGFEPFWQL